MTTPAGEVALSGAPAPRRSGVRRVVRALATLVLTGVAVHVLLPMLASAGDSVAVLRRLAWWAVALAAVAQGLSYWGSGYLLRALVALAGERLSVARGVTITLAASTVGLVAGGVVGTGAATHRWVRASGVGPAGGALATWVPPVLNNLALLLLALLGVLQLLALHALSRVQAVGFALAAVVLGGAAGLAWWAVRHRARLEAAAARLEAWRRRRDRSGPATVPTTSARTLASTLDALAVLRGRRWRHPALGAVSNLGFDALTLFLLFAAAGHAVSPGVLLAGYGLPLLLGKLALLPGGVGVVEATMVALYHALGVPTMVAVLVVLAYRVLSFWLPTLLGAPLWLYLRIREHPHAGTAPPSAG